MANITEKNLKSKTPLCGTGENCNTCKSRSWCKLAEGHIKDFRVEGLETDVAISTATKGNYHIAIDIGTTTIASALVKNGNVIATTGFVNPQIKWGTDVLTRAQKSIQGEGEAMKVSIQDAIKKAIQKLCEEIDILPKQINGGVITGNTTMLYLLTGRNPECLTKAPFEADWLGDEKITIGDINFYIPPCISAFVGADAVCAALATGLTENHETAILTDIGTNGEILLWHNGKLTCCSAAAGPAFEGFGLSRGMGASAGAVEHVDIVGDSLIYKVIGNTEPEGLCGTGVIDLIVCLKLTGVLEVNGTLNEEHFLLNGNDVHMIQLAKAAVCAGIMTTMEKAALTPNRIEAFYIAGGFGKNLNIQNAAHISLFPLGLSKKAKVTGNSALKGAVLLCENPETMEKAKTICRKAEVVKLTEEETFAKKFIECMAIKPII